MIKVQLRTNYKRHPEELVNENLTLREYLLQKDVPIENGEPHPSLRYYIDGVPIINLNTTFKELSNITLVDNIVIYEIFRPGYNPYTGECSA